MSSSTGEGLLVVGPAWVGDMIMAGSLFRLLKEEDPKAHLTVVAPPSTAALLTFMADVDRIEKLPVQSGEAALAKRWRLGRSLAHAGIERAIVLPRSWKAALLPYAARIPRRVGYAGEPRWPLLNDRRPFDRRAIPRTVDRFLALARPRGAAIPEVTPELQFEVPRELLQLTLEKSGLTVPEEPLLALCPGAAYGPAKRWPAEHFAAVAAAWAQQGGRIWVFGQPADADAGAAISAAAPAAVSDLTGKTGLAEAVTLLSLADRVVSNDSGLMHVAAALAKPLVALYGSSAADETPPLSPSAQVLEIDLPCRPCHKRVCPLGHLQCLNDLSPAMVLNALDRR